MPNLEKRNTRNTIPKFALEIGKDPQPRGNLHVATGGQRCENDI